MLKYLRITATALSLMACVLLIALWAGSSARLRKAYVRIASHYFEASSAAGRFGIQIIGEHFKPGERAMRWGALSRPVDDKYPVFPNIENGKLGFSLRHDIMRIMPNIELAYWRFTVPCWFLVGVTLSIAWLPWVRWRFSLRTLLIATTLVAAALAAVVATV